MGISVRTAETVKATPPYYYTSAVSGLLLPFRSADGTLKSC